MPGWAFVSLASVLVVVAAGCFVVRNWPSPPIAPAMPLLLGAGLVYTVGDLMTSLVSGEPRGEWVAAVVLYTGLMALGPLCWLLAVRFAELREVRVPWVRPSLLWVPFGIAALCWLGLLTNPWHGRFLTLAEGRNHYHALWYVHSLNAYLSTLGAFGVYLAVLRRGRRASTRSQALWLLLASALPGLGNLAYVLPSRQLPFDPTALGFAVSCALVVGGIYRREIYSLSVGSLSKMLEHDSDTLMMVDRSGRLLHANAAAHRLLGDFSVAPGGDVVSRLAEVLRRPGSERLSGEAEIRERLLTAEGSLGELFCVGTREPRWLRFETTPVHGAKRRLTAYLLRARDETELRRATEAEAEQAAALEAVFAATGEGICVTDLQGTVRFVNRRFQEISRGRARVGAGVMEIQQAVLPHVSDGRAFEASVEALRRDPTLPIQDDVAMRDGRVLERVSLPLYRDGAVAGRVWQIRDVTEQRRAEEALRNAQKLESLGLMAGGIAHDFNNLLVAVLGNADLALERVPPGDALHAPLRDVRTAAERGSELTRQLLAYAGRTTGSEENVDPSALVRDMLDLLTVSVSRRIRVERHLPAGLPTVRGDASQLRQVVMNLVINAADAIGDADGRIEVETGYTSLGEAELEAALFSAGAEPGPHVYLRVRDDGTGMDDATRRRIFDPFFTTKATGRGLGLAAALGIVKAHGGVVSVESEPGRGATFTVHLPCDAGSTGTVGLASPEHEVRLRGHGRILVADDEVPVLRVACRILEGLGFEVVTAADGLHALDAWRAYGGDFRAALLDMSMPRLGGEGTLQRLRELDPKLPVVLSSGFTTDEPPLEPGAAPVRFLPKPYRRSALVRVLAEVLGET